MSSWFARFAITLVKAVIVCLCLVLLQTLNTTCLVLLKRSDYYFFFVIDQVYNTIFFFTLEQATIGSAMRDCST